MFIPNSAVGGLTRLLRTRFNSLASVGTRAAAEALMPDPYDHLALDIRFALKHGPVSQATRKFVRGLSELDL